MNKEAAPRKVSFLCSDSGIKRTTPIEKTTEQPAKCKKRDQNALAAGGPIAYGATSTAQENP